MNTEWAIAITNALIILLENLQKNPTIDDAIAALEAAKTKTWEQYKQEATLSNPVPVPSPATPPASEDHPASPADAGPEISGD